MSWIRKLALNVIDETGNGIDLGQFRVTFKTTQQNLQSPNTAIITVYNVSDETAAKIQDEYSSVILQAGYEDGDIGTIFQGQLAQVFKGRENQTDTYVKMLCAEGDQAYCFSVVSTTIAAGGGLSDQLKAVQNAMQPYGIGSIYSDGIIGMKFPRGQVLHGMARDTLRDVAITTGASWTIQGDTLQVVPITSYVPGEIVVLTSKTGMIGLPEQTQDGIKVKSLLNSRLAPNGLVKLDNDSIQKFQISLDYTAINFVPKLNADGLYKILVCEHTGDSRGNAWYTDLTCIAIDDTVPDSIVAKGYG